MKIIEVEQRTEEWFEARSKVITGTRVKEVKPLTRKAKTGTQPIGLWRLVADYVAYGAEEVQPMSRGTNLETENAMMVVDKFKLKNPLYKCGLWTTDDGMLGSSPDASENVDLPTWSVECKSLNTAEHLYLVFNDLWRKREIPEEFGILFPTRPDTYRGLESVAEEHRHQVLQEFIVDPKLETLYYSLYDPRIVCPELAHYVIVLHRSEMLEEIEAQRVMCEQQAKLARSIAMLVAARAKGML